MFNWSKDYSVGIDEIDRQHKNFIKLINEIADLIGKENRIQIIEIKVKELEDYAKWHFQTEMLYMKKCKQCSGNQIVENHVKEHNEILEKIADFRKDIGNFDADFVTELMVFIKKWFIHHTLGADKKLYDFLKKQNFEEIIIKDKKP